MAARLWGSITVTATSISVSVGIVASATTIIMVSPLARGFESRALFFSLLYSFISKGAILRYDREEEFLSFSVVRITTVIEELVIEEEEFLKLAGKGRLHYFLFLDPVFEEMEGKRVDVFIRRVCLDVTAKSPEGHVMIHSITFGKYSIHLNKLGVLTLEEDGQDAMRKARAWQETHFPKATRGKWRGPQNE